MQLQPWQQERVAVIMQRLASGPKSLRELSRGERSAFATAEALDVLAAQGSVRKGELIEIGPRRWERLWYRA